MGDLGSVYVVPGYTFFYYGFTIPKKQGIEFQEHFGLGKEKLSMELQLLIHGRLYPAKLRVARITTSKFPNRNVPQFNWETQQETLKALRKMFVYSYATTINKSKPKLKELAEFEYVGKNIFKVKAISHQETDFDTMFREMEDRQLFEYWKKMGRGEEPSFFIEASKHWIGVDKLKEYSSRPNVIYILYNSRTHQIYVGKANMLGNRVKSGEGRIGLEKDWDKFMYFVIAPEYNPFIEQIENFAIRSYAAILGNQLRITPVLDKKMLLVNRRLNGE